MTAYKLSPQTAARLKEFLGKPTGQQTGAAQGQNVSIRQTAWLKITVDNGDESYDATPQAYSASDASWEVYDTVKVIEANGDTLTVGTIYPGLCCGMKDDGSGNLVTWFVAFAGGAGGSTPFTVSGWVGAGTDYTETTTAWLTFNPADGFRIDTSTDPDAPSGSPMVDMHPPGEDWGQAQLTALNTFTFGADWSNLDDADHNFYLNLQGPGTFLLYAVVRGQLQVASGAGSGVHVNARLYDQSAAAVVPASEVMAVYTTIDGTMITVDGGPSFEGTATVLVPYVVSDTSSHTIILQGQVNSSGTPTVTSAGICATSAGPDTGNTLIGYTRLAYRATAFNAPFGGTPGYAGGGGGVWYP